MNLVVKACHQLELSAVHHDSLDIRSVLQNYAQTLIICLIWVTNQRKCDDISFISRAREACAEQDVAVCSVFCFFFTFVFFPQLWLVVKKKHCNWKEAKKKGEKREEQGLELKDTSCLYILSLVQISALECASGNKSVDEPVCEWESATFLCVCVCVWC